MPRLPTRLIPAHAGKTLTRDECLHISSGSSPLTRGKRSRGEKAGGGGGLIPAHAGKTKRSDHTDPGPAAHPRSRGENKARAIPVIITDGSSPLTRGKPRVGGRRRAGIRLIPAHAGKTREPDLPCSHAKAHPRSRGENKDSGGAVRGRPGSSPLTRGKLGFTAAIRASPLAHPRSRGENSLLTPMDSDRYGSSPLTRGKPSERGCVSCLTGLIPAHAGKTSLGRQRSGQ